jgi:hypothetical protein
LQPSGGAGDAGSPAGAGTSAEGGAAGSVGTPPDGPVLQLEAVTPTSGMKNVDPDGTIELQFSSPIDEATIADGIVIVSSGGRVTGSFAHSEGSVTFTPAQPLCLSEKYEVTINRDLRSTENGALEMEETQSFSTREGSWQAPATIGGSFAGSEASYSIAADHSGNVLAVWQVGSSVYDTAANVYSAKTGGWLGAERIETNSATQYTSTSYAAFDFEGNALAIWSSLGMNSRPAGGNWGTATHPSGFGAISDLEFSPSGHGLALWTYTIPNTMGNGRYVEYRKHVPGSGWQPTQSIEGNQSDRATLARIGDDSFLVVYAHGTNGLKARTHDPEAGFGTAKVLAPTLGSLSVPAVASDGASRALVAWSENTTAAGGTVALQWYDVANDTWGEAKRLDALHAIGRISLAVGSNGTAMALWGDPSINGGSVVSSYFDGQEWSASAKIVTAGGNANVFLDHCGRAIAVWETYSPQEFYTSRFVPGDGWSSAQQVTSTLDFAGLGGAVMDPAGRVTALWRVKDAKAAATRYE